MLFNNGTIFNRFKSILETNINIVWPENFNEWNNLIESNDFIISTRVHTCIKSLSLNCPTLCIVHDSRTLELCEKMKIPFSKKLKSLDELAEKRKQKIRGVYK